MDAQQELTDDEKQILSNFAGVQRTLTAGLPLADEDKTKDLVQRAQAILEEKGVIASEYVSQISSEQLAQIYKILKLKEESPGK